MKKAYLKELQGHLLGSVTDNAEALDYFSTDASIFQLVPEGVVYPKNTADVRKTLTFLSERAAQGKVVGVTARGKGSDQTGGAIGRGLQMVFPAHMNRLLQLDKDSVTVQPGLLYGSLQQTLHSHGRFLPPYPASLHYSTIGGAVANNAAGEKTVKYGATRQFVKSLRVVLADGSLIEAKPISPRELNRKKGQSDLEGEIYRKVDGLLLDNAKAIQAAAPKTTKNASGYALWDVRGRDGSFDLSQLIIGSQGTLGVVTEITLKTLPYNAKTTLLVGYFDDLAKAGQAVEKLLPLRPSALELVDYHLLEYLKQQRPQDLEGVVPDILPKLVLLVEFDDASHLQQAIRSRRASRILLRLSSSQRVTTNPIEQAALWKLRHSAAAAIWMNNSSQRALPFIEDGIVPVAALPQFLEKTYKLLRKHNLDIAVWGHAGDANLHLQPFLSLAKPKDVDKLYKLADDFTKLVMSLGGSLSGEHNDGLLRGPYLKELFGAEIYDLFGQVKAAFDPHGILNPETKLNLTEASTRPLVRKDYSMKHLYDHMPHT
jgi:FAD/FMN-containing dehydrogenase